MSLQDQFDMGRTPLKPLPYSNKQLAQASEIMIDYVGDNPTYHIYIVDSSDATKIIDITSYLIKEAFGNDITIGIDGITEPMTLHDVINFIYKRFAYPDNALGFNYDTDIEKLYDPETTKVLLKNTNGRIYLPITSADCIYDNKGNTIQSRLDDIARVGFSNDYTMVQEEGQNIFEINLPFPNYFDGGNYLEVRVGTVFVDKTRYQITENYNSSGEAYTATLTFFNDEFEKGRRIDFLYIYNVNDQSGAGVHSMSGGQIANHTISYSKLEKVCNDYETNDSSAIASASAVNALYRDFVTALNNSSESTFYTVDESIQGDSIYVNMVNSIEELSTNYIMLNIYTASIKNKNITLTINYGKGDNTKTASYDLTFKNKVPSNTIIRVLVSSTGARSLVLTDDMLTSNKYIYSCKDAETVIPFTNLTYEYGSIIRVYRNGLRLFEDLDYSMNIAAQQIKLYNRTELGERIVFESISL